MELSSNLTKELVLFFILAYAISWSIGIPLALARQDIIGPVLPQWTDYLVAFGPAISALLMTVVYRGASGLKEIGKSLFRIACPKWILTSISPFLIGWLTMSIFNRLSGSSMRLSMLGQINYLPIMPAGLSLLL